MSSSSLEDLFSEALQRPEGPERDAWVTAACEGAPMLESELRALLAAHESADDAFLRNPFDSGSAAPGAGDP